MLKDDFLAAAIAGVIVISATLTIAGEALEGHLVHGILLGALLVGFAWHWRELRSGHSDRATPDTLAAWLSAVAGFGLAAPRLDVVIAWLRGG